MEGGDGIRARKERGRGWNKGKKREREGME